MLDDREAETGAAGGARGVGAPEALEEAWQVVLGDADPVVGGGRARPRPARARSMSVKVRAVAGVADRVLGEVLGDDPEHPRAERQVDVASPSAFSVKPARAARELAARA